MKIKEVTVSSSKSLQYGQYKSGCSITVEFPEGNQDEVKGAIKEAQKLADAAVAYGIKQQMGGEKNV